MYLNDTYTDVYQTLYAIGHYFGPDREGVVGVKVDRYRVNSGIFVPRLRGLFLDGPVRTWPAVIEHGRGLLRRHASFRVFYTVAHRDKTWPAHVQEALVFRLYHCADTNGVQMWSLEATDAQLVHMALER